MKKACSLYRLVNSAKLFCFFCYFTIVLLIASCESFVEIAPPSKELSPKLVFTNDQSASAAVLGIYTDLWTLGYDMARFTGRSSDEFMNFSGNVVDVQFFAN